MKLWNSPLRQGAAVLCTAALAVLAACGGGGSSSPTTTTGGTSQATAFSQGPISGFGSVIVNGVRWDDSSASVVDDDGVSHSSGDLKLGMMVSVDGGSVDRSNSSATPSGKAMSIHFGSETKGPISSVDTAGSSFVVLGITVVVDANTVFDASISGGIAGLAAAQVVEVHGIFDAANNKITATRVELEDSTSSYKMRGTITAIDLTAKTFLLGTQKISFAALAALPTWVVEGVQAKAVLNTTPDSAGNWVATKLRPIGTSVEDRSEAEVEGSISVFTSVTDFEVNGMKVDASKATLPADTSVIVLGAHVEVKGAVVSGVLVATSVKVETESHGGSGGGGGDHSGGGTPKEFELHGTITTGTLDTTAKTFTLRGIVVSYGGTVEFKDGTVANLLEGAQLEVKGTLSSDGTKLDATRIDFGK
jgi:hypothetical protein